MTNVLKMLFIICLAVFSKIMITKKIANDVKRERFEAISMKKTNNPLQDMLNRIKGKKNILDAVVPALLMLLSMLNGFSLIKSIGYGVGGYVLILWYRKVRRRNEEKQVMQDLLNVTECIRVQLSAQISLEIALRSISEVCVNRKFRNHLTNLYLEYELSKFTVGTSANEIQKKYNYPEIRMFISALNQQSQGTYTLETFDNLLEVLKEKEVDYMEETTKSKVAAITFGVFLSVANIASISIYPIAVEAIDSVKMILM